MKMAFLLILLSIYSCAGIVSWMSPEMQSAATAINQQVVHGMSAVNDNFNSMKKNNLAMINVLSAANKTHLDTILASQKLYYILLSKRYENNKKIQKLFLGE